MWEPSRQQSGTSHSWGFRYLTLCTLVAGNQPWMKFLYRGISKCYKAGIIFKAFFRPVLHLWQNWKDTEISPKPLPHTCRASPNINIPHSQSGTFVTTEPAWTYRNHPKSTVYIRVHRVVVDCAGLDECVMTRIHRHVIQSIFTALKTLHAPSVHPPPTRWSFHCLHSFAFSRTSYNWDKTLYSIFRLTSFT